MKKNILIVVGTMAVGGNERFVINLLKNLDKERFSSDLLIYSDINLCEDWLETAMHNCNKVFLNINENHSFIKDIHFARAILKKNSYDVIHCNSCSLLGLLRTVIANKYTKNTKIIAHSHNAGTHSKNVVSIFFKNLMKIYLSNNIDFAFACSDIAAKSKFTKKILKSKKFTFINNAIDSNEYKFNLTYREEIRKDLDIDESTFLIGNVGRLNYQKNQIYLLNILYELLSFGINSKLLIIGDGEEKKSLLQKSEELNIQDNLILLGSRNDINRYYNAMDCFVMPSRFEGFPFVLVEAQINGLRCVISSNISRNVDIVNQIQFVELNDLKQWLDKIMQINGRLSMKDVDVICKTYDIKKEIGKIEDIYLTL